MASLHYNKRSKAELANRISDVLISCDLSFRLLIVLWMRRHTGPPFLREKVLQNDSKNKLIRENPFAWAHALGHVCAPDNVQHPEGYNSLRGNHSMKLVKDFCSWSMCLLLL